MRIISVQLPPSNIDYTADEITTSGNGSTLAPQDWSIRSTEPFTSGIRQWDYD